MEEYFYDLKEFQNTLYNRTNDDLHREGQPIEIGEFTKLAELRGKLIVEEAGELEDALNNETPEQVLKELSDLLYVILGTMVVYSLPPHIVRSAFEKVHANNMAKITFGTVNEAGKLIKPKDHPKVDLSEEAKSWLNQKYNLTFTATAL